MKRLVGLCVLPLVFAPAIAVANPAGISGDYPTATVADYVLGCMKSNGETREALERCSCSIDVIASILPYERYETGRDVQEHVADDGRERRPVSRKRAGQGRANRTEARAGRSRRPLLLEQFREKREPVFRHGRVQHIDMQTLLAACFAAARLTEPAPPAATDRETPCRPYRSASTRDVASAVGGEIEAEIRDLRRSKFRPPSTGSVGRPARSTVSG